MCRLPRFSPPFLPFPTIRTLRTWLACTVDSIQACARCLLKNGSPSGRISWASTFSMAACWWFPEQKFSITAIPILGSVASWWLRVWSSCLTIIVSLLATITMPMPITRSQHLWRANEFNCHNGETMKPISAINIVTNHSNGPTSLSMDGRLTCILIENWLGLGTTSIGWQQIAHMVVLRQCRSRAHAAMPLTIRVFLSAIKGLLLLPNNARYMSVVTGSAVGSAAAKKSRSLDLKKLMV